MTANTFTWIGGTSSATLASNWWVGGSSSTIGQPGPGDTAIVTVGTVVMPLDATFSSNTLEIGGTASAAGFVLQRRQRDHRVQPVGRRRP